MTTSKNLYALEFRTQTSFQKNLNLLVSLIQKCDEGFIQAPEVCLSGFCYERMDEAAEFSLEALKVLFDLSYDKSIALTMIIKEDGVYKNRLFVLDKCKIIHTQDKHKLFPLGKEDAHFSAGALEEIAIYEIDGIKFASLICFELRFSELWERVKGADVITVPAMWGKERKDHYKSLTKSLSIMNQCFVICSDSSNPNMAASSQIFNPFGHHSNGVLYQRGTTKIYKSLFEQKSIQAVRRYINIGIGFEPTSK